MIIPIYDIATLPPIIYPMTNEQEETEIYLGGRAVTGYITADIKIKAKNDAQMEALYNFWVNDCNYGLEPFLIPLTMFGKADSITHPSLLMKFSGPITAETSGCLWNSSIKLDRIGTIDYVIDDQGNFIVSDLGEYTIVDGKYVPTGLVINSFREVLY